MVFLSVWFEGCIIGLVFWAAFCLFGVSCLSLPHSSLDQHQSRNCWQISACFLFEVSCDKMERSKVIPKVNLNYFFQNHYSKFSRVQSIFLTQSTRSWCGIIRVKPADILPYLSILKAYPQTSKGSDQVSHWSLTTFPSTPVLPYRSY
jgi:hypothetical protein